MSRNSNNTASIETLHRKEKQQKPPTCVPYNALWMQSPCNWAVNTSQSHQESFHLSSVQNPSIIPFYWLVKSGIPLLDYYNPQFLLRIFIPQLIINQKQGWIAAHVDRSQGATPLGPAAPSSSRQPSDQICLFLSGHSPIPTTTSGKRPTFTQLGTNPFGFKKYWLRVWSMHFWGALYRGMFVLGGVWSYHVFHP